MSWAVSLSKKDRVKMDRANSLRKKEKNQDYSYVGNQGNTMIRIS